MDPENIEFTTHSRSGTTESYEDLYRSDLTDVDMELWRSVAPVEAAKYINASLGDRRVRDAGESYYARSGLFIRPSTADAQTIQGVPDAPLVYLCADGSGNPIGGRISAAAGPQHHARCATPLRPARASPPAAAAAVWDVV
eukprot:7057250-Prymnesium_polylepis.1